MRLFFCSPRAPTKRRRSGTRSPGVARLQRSAGSLCRTILATQRLLPSYNKTYGSFGAVIDLTTWKWLSSIVILLGAELNALMAHHTASDTTRESPCVQRVRGTGAGRSRERKRLVGSGPQPTYYYQAADVNGCPCRIFKLGCTCDILYSTCQGEHGLWASRGIGVSFFNDRFVRTSLYKITRNLRIRPYPRYQAASSECFANKQPRPNNKIAANKVFFESSILDFRAK